MTDFANVQAVVFAGGIGNRMINLTEQMQKSLLPVGNIPLFMHPLNMLARNSIKDVILVTNEHCHVEVKEVLEHIFLRSISSLNIDVVCLTTDIADDVEQWGTADVLRHIRPKIKMNCDLLLVSGDIVSDLSLSAMYEYHRKVKSAFTCLFWDSPLSGPIPGVKSHKKYRDFSAFVRETGELLYLAEEEDFDVACDYDTRLFKAFPKVLFSSKFKDVHVYLLNPALIEILNHATDFTSIKADLIPHLLKGQYISKIGHQIVEYCEPIAMAAGRSVGLCPRKRNNHDRENEEYSAESKRKSHYNCYAYVADGDSCSLLAQCNTVASYFEANKAVQRILKCVYPELAEKTISINFKALKANVSESQFGEDISMGEKVVTKKSVIGPKCTLGNGVKVENSLLMSGVAVRNGAIIKNSIVFPGAEIGEKAELGMCIVGVNQTIKPKVKYVNTVIREEQEMRLDE